MQLVFQDIMICKHIEKQNVKVSLGHIGWHYILKINTNNSNLREAYTYQNSNQSNYKGIKKEILWDFKLDWTLNQNRR